MKAAIVTAVVAATALAGFAASKPGGVLRPALPEVPRQDELSLSLRNPGTHLRVGLPDFLRPSDDPALAAAAGTVAGVLWDDLDFEREFYMISRDASASLPVMAADQLPFQAWADLGADLVVAASARGNAREITIDLRLIAVQGAQPGRQMFGERYTCGITTSRGARDCAHRIADDIHLQTRALKGVARTRLAFVSDRDNARIARLGSDTVARASEIYIADYDGANSRRVTTAQNTSCCPNWSPDGRRLAYVSWQPGWPNVALADLERPGGGPSYPAGATAFVQNWSPSWSPDGSRLAFASNRSGNLDIWVVSRDGSGLTNLTNHPAQDGAPTWSPNGAQIAFTSDRAGKNQLYVMNAQGVGVNILVSEAVDRPTWSPLNFIAFTLAPEHGPHQVALYDVTTAKISVLTHEGVNESPAVAPNGRHIAFVTTRWGGEQIAVMDRTGEYIHRVTTAGRNTYPSWEPRVP
jgi:TolB protein